MTLYKLVQDLCDTQKALEVKSSRNESIIDTAMRVAKVNLLDEIINNLMSTDEYYRCSNLVADNKIPDMTFKAK